MRTPPGGISRRSMLRGAAFGAVAIGAGPLIAACSGGSSSSSASSGSSVNAGKATKLTMWGSFSGTQIGQINQMLTSFHAAQPDITVSYQAQGIVETKLTTAIAAGTGIPDIVLWDRYQTSLYAPKGALSPVDDLVSRDKVDLSAFFQAPLGEMRIDGKLYGMPIMTDNRSLFYNKTLLDAKGIKPPTTWDEINAAAAELTVRKNGKLVTSGFAIDDPGLYNMWILQAGGQMLSSDKKTVAFDDSAGLAVLNEWGDIMHSLKAFEVGFGSGIDGFGTGAYAMHYDGPWNLPMYDAIKGFEYGVVVPATGPGGNKGAITGGFGLVIPNGAPNRDAAWEFLKWWATNPANGVAFAKIGSWLPGTVAAVQDPYFKTGHWPALVETMNFATVRPNTPGYSDVEGKALDPQLQNFMSGKQTAAATLSTAAQQGNQILAQDL